jgi:hypothetical protein
MTAPTLEALLRRCARAAEQAFNDAGEIDPMWLVETASGEQQLLVTPIGVPEGLAAHKFKDLLDALMRKKFRDMKVVRYAVAMECWLSRGLGLEPGKLTPEQVERRYAELGHTLGNAPDRQEIMLIEAEDEKEFLSATREIVRSPHGKAYLGKLGAIERPNASGRFLGLLPSQQHARAQKEVLPTPDQMLRRRKIRSSRELPDDVGKVFVTKVPGAPLQIIGRRDPATGELLVGRLFLPSPLDRPLPAGIEVVTGPEAEELIAAVHRVLMQEASKQGLTFQEYAEQQDAARIAGIPPTTEREVELFGRIERAFQAALSGRDSVSESDFYQAAQKTREAVPDATMAEIERAIDWAKIKRKRQ